MKIDVLFDARLATLQLTAYRQALADKAVARALNRTATTVRAEAARLIAGELRPVNVGEIKKGITIRRATRNFLTATVRANGRRKIPITALKARQTKKGVTVRVGGKTYSIDHAFITKKGNRDKARLRAPSFKGQLVTATDYRAKRTGKKGPDYPVAELFVPGVPTVFVEARILRALGAVARQRFAVALAQEVKFATSKL